MRQNARKISSKERIPIWVLYACSVLIAPKRKWREEKRIEDEEKQNNII